MMQNKIEHVLHSYAANKGWIDFNIKNAEQCKESWAVQGMLSNANCPNCGALLIA